MANKYAYEKMQTSAFSALVEDGTYSVDFDHGKPAQKFFSSVMSNALESFSKTLKNGIRVIDCGCGNGAWLDYLARIDHLGRIESIHGFDLTPEMVTVAHDRLEKKSVVSYLQAGNVLETASYEFADSKGKFDLVFTYDVIQQLPPKMQFDACQKIVDQLADGGHAIIFDNDGQSKFGRRMARKKFLTRYFGLKLVPRYYCNAVYPPLEKFADRLALDSGLEVKIEVSESEVKRALIIRRVTAK